MGASPDRVDRIQDQWRRERPDLDPSPQGVIGRVHRLALELTARLTPVYEAHGLSEAEFDLLASLRRRGAPYELPAGELADHTMVTTGGLTKRVDRLLARGLVERRASDEDARRRLIRLTGAGRALIDEAFSAHLANEHRLLRGLDADDLAAMESITRRWLRLLSDDSSPP
ncbi:DNA-binding MarR family transcriptional regulator [Salana multivorans]|uniref:DNA-binding MarR family transcriptional regulator n=1 Tax=Salana multivorans TaxID=120377 RepID=A0A3N2DCK5_9MICO|nr:MarR family transcriptional regulator [Salana multivorans]MBN8881290.1 MarR family transcriptional regulator [Salana multivorans]OJX95990.1 MAG: MarR family transcriptional regulator [Micrococcales bacterium 73-15]ROR97174.1 DNA-binding MarR family transcriptional regulator [Salana multivorans]